jgi:hypothetical protein
MKSAEKTDGHDAELQKATRFKPVEADGAVHHRPSHP